MTEARVDVLAKPVHRYVAGLLLAITLLLAPSPAKAIAQLSCWEPGVFGGAAVNVVLIPYTYTGAERWRPLSQAAENLSLLLQLDVLSAARYGSLGVIRLQGDAEECRPERVLGMLRRGEVSGEHGQLRDGGGVAVLWGRFFEAKGTLYVQSYLDFFRYNADESIRLPLNTPAGALEFTVRLPAHRVAFRPRSVALSDLEDVNRFFAETSTLRQEPDPSAPLVQAEPFDVRDFVYGVRPAGEGWLELVPYGDVPGGYVRLGGETSDFLKRLLPELALVDAAIGYLTYRAAYENPEAFGSTAGNVLELLERSSRVYREFVDPREEPLPVSLAHALPAAARLLAVTYDRLDPLQAAGELRERLDRAVALLPDNAELLNLHAIGRIVLCCATGAERASAEGIEDELHRAMVVAPIDPHVVSTLKNFYRLLLELVNGTAPLPREELQRRLGAVEKIRVSERY